MKPAKSEIAAAYNEWSKTYDDAPNQTVKLAGQVLRQANLNIEDRNVVEVGCGTGRNTEWLARTPAGARDIVALDFSEGMLARARERVADARVRFLQQDVRQRWPLADSSADLVIAMLILEHVELLEPFFTEAARILSTGGELFICELHPMRQLQGGQAQFTSAHTGERQLVTAFLHNTSDYVNTALSSGFALIKLGEWRDEGALPTDSPRLLSLHLTLAEGVK